MKTGSIALMILCTLVQSFMVNGRFIVLDQGSMRDESPGLIGGKISPQDALLFNILKSFSAIKKDSPIEGVNPIDNEIIPVEKKQEKEETTPQVKLVSTPVVKTFSSSLGQPGGIEINFDVEAPHTGKDEPQGIPMFAMMQPNKPKLFHPRGFPPIMDMLFPVLQTLNHAEAKPEPEEVKKIEETKKTEEVKKPEEIKKADEKIKNADKEVKKTDEEIKKLGEAKKPEEVKKPEEIKKTEETKKTEDKKCAETVCVPPPTNMKCEKSDMKSPIKINDCCPMWLCTAPDGTVMTHYGISKVDKKEVKSPVVPLPPKAENGITHLTWLKPKSEEAPKEEKDEPIIDLMPSMLDIHFIRPMPVHPLHSMSPFSPHAIFPLNQVMSMMRGFPFPHFANFPPQEETPESQHQGIQVFDMLPGLNFPGQINFPQPQPAEPFPMPFQQLFF